MTPGGERRAKWLAPRIAGKSRALELWREAQRDLGTHAHVLHPTHTECVNGQCVPCVDCGQLREAGRACLRCWPASADR